MITKLTRYFFAAAGTATVFLTSAFAFDVDDTGIAPGQTVNISVNNFYTGEAAAGINKLVVDGHPTDGFCIDPFHFSVSSSPGYEHRNLGQAPKLPGTMGAEKGEELRKLWAMVYSPLMTAEQAAGLQVAIWELVGGDNFAVSGNDYGAGQMLRDVQSFTGPGARLVAVSGPGQDYVIPRVPEGGSTIYLFAFAVFVTFGVRFLYRQRLCLATCAASAPDRE